MPATLDGPPPSPAMLGMGTGASPAPPPGGYGGLAPTGAPSMGIPGAGNVATPDIVNQMLEMGKQIDAALAGFAQMLPQSAAEFRQAQQSMQAGFAKALQGGPPATSPTAVGGQFPGGGFSGGMP